MNSQQSQEKNVRKLKILTNDDNKLNNSNMLQQVKNNKIYNTYNDAVK